MNRMFGFESDFVDSLRCIPMAVRYRLDITGVKLKLSEWSKLGKVERRVLVERPFASTEDVRSWKEALSLLVAEASGAAPALLPALPETQWESPTLPEQVRLQAAAEGLTLSNGDWASLDIL